MGDQRSEAPDVVVAKWCARAYVKGVQRAGDGVGTVVGTEGIFYAVLARFTSAAEATVVRQVDLLAVPIDQWDWWVSRIGKWVEFAVAEADAPSLVYRSVPRERRGADR